MGAGVITFVFTTIFLLAHVCSAGVTHTLVV